MTLGEIIKHYRDEHGLSQREFAELAGISNQYVSLLEKGVNNDGKPLSPRMSMYNTIAETIGIPINDLLTITSGSVTIAEEKEMLTAKNSDEQELLDMINQLDDYQKAVIRSNIKFLLSQQE